MATKSLDEETTKKVIRQVEFYFSDSNLPRDKFLSGTISESEDGMVSLALICSFSRMRTHLGLGDAKPEDVPEDTVMAVAETLRTSSFLKISEDGKQVGRTTELPKPEEVIEQLDVRTVAASPLQYDVKLEDVESFFGQFAQVNSVRLPRNVADKRLFCGTALVEFSTEEDATKVLTQTLCYAGAELELKPKKEFDAERAKEAELVENSRSQMGSNRRNGASSEPSYPKGLIVAFTLKSMSAGDSAAQSACEDPANGSADADKTDGEPDSKENINEEANNKASENVDVNEANNGKNIEESEEKVDEKTCVESKEAEEGQKDGQKDDAEATGEENTTAAMYKDNKDVVLREDLRSIFEKFGKVKFIDFTIGADSGYIRFEEAAAAQKARTAGALDERGGLSVKNYIAMLDPVTGDAEKEYWSLLRNSQDRYRDSRGNNRGGRGGGRHNRGGRHQHYGKNNRSRENDSSNRPNKVQKVGAA
ncbi:hypothetical protein LguiA_033289 [Lonicera macranthoides]